MESLKIRLITEKRRIPLIKSIYGINVYSMSIVLFQKINNINDYGMRSNADVLGERL